MKSKDEIIATLKKLKAMAEKGCNEQEVETAARMLHKQMEKHGVTLEDLRDERKAGVACEETSFRTRNKTETDMQLVLGAIGRLFDCKVWYYTKQHWVFFGLPGDTQAACALAFLVESSVRMECNAYTKGLDKQMYPYRSSYRNHARRDFRRGFLLRVRDRLRDMKQEQVQEQTRNALVVRKQEIIQSAMQEKGIRLGKGRQSTMHLNNTSHFREGQTKGQQADLRAGGQIEAR